MRDFSCCGQTLPTLHDLLQHYEEAHAQQTPHSHRASVAAARARENSISNNKATFGAQSGQSQSQNLQPPQMRQQNGQGTPVGGIQLMRQQQSQPQTPTQANVRSTSDEMDGVEDMEMDDAMGPLETARNSPVQNHQQPMPNMQPSMFGQQPRPNLQINSNGLQHSGLRTSQPSTPAVSGFGFQNNPTVSSVNTPTLTAQPFQQQQTFSPDTSVPGTPAGEMEDDFGTAQMNLNNANMAALNAAIASGDFPFFPGTGGQMGMDALGLDMCIDEPAKRLYSPNGGFNNQRQMQQQFAQFGLGQAQGQFGNNDNLMRMYRQQQAMAMGNMNMTGGMLAMGEEHKPFRCPVIGCEKAYKNQNGLKYHKTHGHQTQRLHENGDGTFSIVNPETSAPYPGTLGMEKEKPYKCEVCGKRYKNLNGLKYHKQHSPPCNPELKLNNHMAAVGLGGLGVNVNVAGLPGIGEEGFPS